MVVAKGAGADCGLSAWSWGGRGQPRLPLARLRVAGDLVDLDFRDLAGTAAEATALFELLSLDVGPVETDVIVGRTEGWMSGLRLAAPWSAAQPRGRRDIRTFAGDERVVADYLSDEILAGQPRAVQRFLLRTCIVDPLNGELADSLTGGRDGARLLDELERENALVESVGPHRTWFRYRPLLREFLRAELNRRRPEEVPLLRRRAARWYARKRLTVDALRNAVEAEDWDFAAQLLAADDRLVEGQGSGVEPLLARIHGRRACRAERVARPADPAPRPG